MSIESIRTESGIFSVKRVRLVSVVDSLFCDAESIGNLSTNVFERRHQPNMEYAFLSTGFVQIFGQIVSRRAETQIWLHRRQAILKGKRSHFRLKYVS